MKLDGNFGLTAEHFSDEAIQGRFDELSRRGLGKRNDHSIERVVTNVTGHFSVRNGVATFPDIAFNVPGAALALTGTYKLTDGQVDLAGTMKTQARLSQAIGGLRSIFLRPLDFAFRRPGAGAVLPVRISGTRNEPKIGLRAIR